VFKIPSGVMSVGYWLLALMGSSNISIGGKYHPAVVRVATVISALSSPALLTLTHACVLAWLDTPAYPSCAPTFHATFSLFCIHSEPEDYFSSASSWHIPPPVIFWMLCDIYDHLMNSDYDILVSVIRSYSSHHVHGTTS